MTRAERQDLGVWDEKSKKFRPRIFEATDKTSIITSLLISRGCQTKGWRTNVTHAVHKTNLDYQLQTIKDELECLGRFVPDAYAIDAGIQGVLAYEIEDGNPLPPEKLKNYLRAWNALAEFEWELTLIRTSPDGIVSIVDFEASESNLLRMKHLNF